MENRKDYLDYLRIISMFAVMFLHLSGENWYSVNVSSFEWNVFNVYDSITRWCVPVFVMISGTLFLSRDIKPLILYKKYILRIFTAGVFWSFIYAIYIGGSYKEIIASTLSFSGHLWFIPMIIGLYICQPILRKIIDKNDSITLYFLICSFIFSFLLPTIFHLASAFGGNTFETIIGIINTDISSMNIYLFNGYISYFVLGYYLDHKNLSSSQRYFIYVVSLLGFGFTIGLTAYISIRNGSPYDYYYNYLNMNVLFESIGVFVFFKYTFKNIKKEFLKNLIYKISKYSFGAYLIHMLFVDILWLNLNITTLSFNPVLSVPFETILIFMLSISASALMNKISWFNKYFV